jgi:hypothetical protein
MASFKKLEWDQFDTWALLVGRGVVTIEPSSLDQANEWLDEHSYKRIHLDFGTGISPVVFQLGKLLEWERQFGYELEPTSRVLAALRDGFEFDVPEVGGTVLCIANFETAMQEDKSWSTRFISIASEYSLHQLALARRFFAVLEISNSQSPILGETFDELPILNPFRFRGKIA